jgi:Fe-S-cluster formation regulator IscX/YfhJ
MTTESSTPKPSFLARLGRFLFRLFVVVVIGIALGVGIYFGVLAMYRIYVQPVQGYDARLDALESGMSQAEQLVVSRSDTLTERLDALEIQGDTTKETLADLDSRLAVVESEQAAQAAELSAMAESLDTLQTSISDLQTNQTAMQSDLDDLQKSISDLEALSDDLATAGEAILENSQNIETMSLGVQESVETARAVKQEVTLLKAMEMLTRSRIFLSQGNISLAQTEIRAAASLLTALQEQLPEGQAAFVGEAVDVLNESLSYLPRSPLLASDRVEGAWQMLFEGLPEETAEGVAAEGTETPAVEGTPTTTPTPTP